jgi:hypothetical protein
LGSARKRRGRGERADEVAERHTVAIVATGLAGAAVIPTITPDQS